MTGIGTHQRRPASRPPPHPPARRQPGYTRRLLWSPQSVLDELAGQYGPIFGLGVWPARIAVVGDPDGLRELFSMPVDRFRWGHKFNVLGFVVGPGSMIVSDGADHKRRRGAVQPAFSRRRLNAWIPMIVETADAAIDTLPDHATDLDMDLFGRALVLDIVVRALFGAGLADRAEEIGRIFQGPQDYLEAPALRQLPHPLPFTRRARVRANRRALDAIIDEAIADRRADTTSPPADVLETLVDDATLPDAEIRDQVVTLLGAGFDTTSATLAWMLWRAALAPGLWTALRDEADATFKDLAPAQSDERTLASLDLADRVMRETTRLHPAGAISPREAATDLDVAGYRIRKGTLILWSAHMAGRDAAAWRDPLVFDPDRFCNLSSEQQALADTAWVPFGRGARNCIGFALAQMELTLIIARLAQRLDLTALSDRVPDPVGMVVNRPAGGVPLRVAPRH